MGAWELILIGVVLLLGLSGVLVPGVPASWLIWAAILWWSLTEPGPAAWAVLVGTTVVLLLSLAVRWTLPPRRLRAVGTTDLAVYAGTGAVLGFVLIPVLGAVPGFMAGIYLHERLRLGRHGEAVAALRSVMRSGGWSVLTELFACLLVTGGWLAAVILG